MNYIKICTLMMLLQSINAKRKREVLRKVRDISLFEIENTDELDRHPKVMSTSCARNIDRLKAGPANVPEVI